MPKVTKHGRVVTYRKEILHIKLHKPLIMWSCGVTEKIKYVISPLVEGLWESQ